MKFRKLHENDVMAWAKSFFPGGLKCSFASVKNNYNYEKRYFECVFGCRVHNITGCATTPDTTVHSTDLPSQMIVCFKPEQPFPMQ